MPYFIKLTPGPELHLLREPDLVRQDLLDHHRLVDALSRDLLVPMLNDHYFRQFSQSFTNCLLKKYFYIENQCYYLFCINNSTLSHNVAKLFSKLFGEKINLKS
jgi:hypothetical protein